MLFAAVHESALGVLREKAALSSGCKPHPRTIRCLATARHKQRAPPSTFTQCWQKVPCTNFVQKGNLKTIQNFVEFKVVTYNAATEDYACCEVNQNGSNAQNNPAE